MPISSWFWLSEAALLVAERLVTKEPEKFSGTDAALTAAREQLVDQAYRGALEIQGRFFQINEEPEAPPLGGWTIVDASYWSPEYRVEPQSSYWVCILKMNWAANSFMYELEDRDDEGYGDLRVRGEDIDRLWPPVDHRGAGSAASTVVVKHAGGAPRKWRDDLLIEIVRIANTPDGLPEIVTESY